MAAAERPLVSVLLPCFEAERFLEQALDSLLGQTYSELEILAIDDASSDRTPRILAEYAARDERVRVLTNEVNLRLIGTLNRGVPECRGELIARMDADDFALSTRIERQVEVFRRWPEVDVVGAGVTLVDDEDGRPLKPQPLRSLSPGGARFTALLATPLAHTTIMARAETMREHPYGTAPDSLHTEDYELFARMLAAGAELRNVDERLMVKRSGSQGVSQQHERVQVDNFVACARRHFERTLGFEPDPAAHRVMVNRIDGTVTRRDLRRGLRLLARVEATFLAREPQAAAEIRRSADLQRVDIVVQAALRAAPGARLASGGHALRYGRRLLAGDPRRYLASKLGLGLAQEAAVASGTTRLAARGTDG